MGSIQVFWMSFTGATSHFAETYRRSNASLYVPSSCSKPKISLKVAFAEAKKAGKTSRRAEDTTKLPLAAGRTACKTWLSFNFLHVLPYMKSIINGLQEYRGQLIASH